MLDKSLYRPPQCDTTDCMSQSILFLSIEYGNIEFSLSNLLNGNSIRSRIDTFAHRHRGERATRVQYKGQKQVGWLLCILCCTPFISLIGSIQYVAVRAFSSLIRRAYCVLYIDTHTWKMRRKLQQQWTHWVCHFCNKRAASEYCLFFVLQLLSLYTSTLCHLMIDFDEIKKQEKSK